MSNDHTLNLLTRFDLLIGVTGHRDLLEEDFDFLENSSKSLNQKVREQLLIIKEKHPSESIALLSCFAERADKLVVHEARQLGIKVIGIFFSNEQVENTIGFDDYIQEEVVDDDTESKKKKEYGRGATIISEYSKYLIALWDGVDTGLDWGTSDIIYSIIRGKNNRGKSIHFKQENKQGTLIHIPARRKANKRLFSNYEFQPLHHNSRISAADTVKEISFPGKSFIQKSRIKIGRYFNFQSDLSRLTITAVLVMFTIGFGYYGFKKQSGFEDWRKDRSPAGLNAAKDTLMYYQPTLSEEEAIKLCIERYDWSRHYAGSGNDFFNSINLITFNSSVQSLEKLHWSFKIARILGLLTVLSGFLSAILLAAGNNIKIRLLIALRVRFLHWLGLRKRIFSIVTGSTLPALDLSMDLKNRKHLVVLLSKDHDSSFESDARTYGIKVYNASPSSSKALRSVAANLADNVFMLSENDSENIRTCRELDQVCSETNRRQSQKSNWYLLIKDQRLNDMVNNSMIMSEGNTIHAINLYENIARRLLNRYPIDRFTDSVSEECTEVFVLGNTEVAKQIVLTTLKLGQYESGKKIKITWFVENKEAFEQDFLRRYPCLDRTNNSFENPFAKEIRNYVFPDDILFFKEMPLSDTEYFNDGRINAAVNAGHIITIYFCLEDSIMSAAYLNAIAIKLDAVQKQSVKNGSGLDIQLFCFYNLQDREEVEHAERICNRNIPHVPVVFFGNFLEECSYSALAEKSLDKLPQLINYWYETGLSAPVEKEETLRKATQSWERLSESHRESSRQAADHLWVKCRILKNQFPGLEFLTERFHVDNPKYSHAIQQLAEIEHYRWCRERLLDSFIPVQDLDPLSTLKPGDYVHNWNSDKRFKSHFQNQKLHIDLVLYEKLYAGTVNGKAFNERYKDISLIQAIPSLYSSIN